MLNVFQIVLTTHNNITFHSINPLVSSVLKNLTSLKMAAEPEDNWAWLALLKWSLNYVDGTVPSEDSPNYQEMSEEDKKFLQEVMQNGVINEGDRMKTILSQCVSYLDSIKRSPGGEEKDEGKDSTSSSDGSSSSSTEEDAPSEEEVEELLQEVKDIIGQIDFAKSFAAMGGIPFLIGCASQTNIVPISIRAACLAVLGTLCQNNPSVQYTMLEKGNLPVLINIFFAEYLYIDGNHNTTSQSPVQVRAVQAISCFIRNHNIAEQIFCMNQEGRKMIDCALGLYSYPRTGTAQHEHEHEEDPQSSDDSDSQRVPIPMPNTSLKEKALFFLQALLTSDCADQERIASFASSIQYISTNFVDPELETNANIRETALSMLTRILDQKKSVNAILDVKNSLVGLGVKRVAEMRALDGDEKEYAEEELRLWELLIMGLARGVRDELNPDVEASNLAIAAAAAAAAGGENKESLGQ